MATTAAQPAPLAPLEPPESDGFATARNMVKYSREAMIPKEPMNREVPPAEAVHDKETVYAKSNEFDEAVDTAKHVAGRLGAQTDRGENGSVVVRDNIATGELEADLDDHDQYQSFADAGRHHLAVECADAADIGLGDLLDTDLNLPELPFHEGMANRQRSEAFECLLRFVDFALAHQPTGRVGDEEDASQENNTGKRLNRHGDLPFRITLDVQDGSIVDPVGETDAKHGIGVVQSAEPSADGFGGNLCNVPGADDAGSPGAESRHKSSHQELCSPCLAAGVRGHKHSGQTED